MSAARDWEWESVGGDQHKFFTSLTERLPVKGGWLYRTTVKDGIGESPALSVSMVFVKDSEGHRKYMKGGE